MAGSIPCMRSYRETRRRNDPSFWTAVNRVLTVLVTVGFLACIVFWIYPEVVSRNKLAANLEAKKAEKAHEQLLIRQHEREIYLLQNDKEYIETIARDKLDLMKEGETIFRFDPPKNAPAQKAN